MAPPMGGQLGAPSGFGGGGPVAFGAASQAQSMPAIGTFGQPNGAPPANGPFGGAVFGGYLNPIHISCAAVVYIQGAYLSAHLVAAGMAKDWLGHRSVCICVM